MVLESVSKLCSDRSKLSRDQLLAACETAWSALGKPAMIPPATQAVTSLAVQMLDEGVDASTLIDRARADDPEGLLDAIGSLREGGFPEGTIEAQPPTNKNELIGLLWDDVATMFFEHQARFGHLELLPSVPLRYGLGTNDRLSGLVNGEPQEVLVLAIDETNEAATIELNGKRVELRLTSGTS